MMRVVLVVALLVAVQADKALFVKWMSKYSKSYSTLEEFQRRYANYMENMNVAKEMTLANNGTAEFGETIFSDLSQQEFIDLYLMKPNPNPMAVGNIPAGMKYAPFPHNNTRRNNPTTFDWRNQGVVTGIYNQGTCGSCWAFSATESIESNSAIAGQQLQNLAMQEFVSCDTQSDGCGGGSPTSAFTYAYQVGGMNTLASYPYTGENSPCEFPQGQTYSQPTQYWTTNTEQEMYENILNVGTVSICLNAYTPVWQNYRGGIVTWCGPEPSASDHCLQVTGYNNWDSGMMPSWNIRNSWGPQWGESGYIQIRTGYQLCGVGRWASIVGGFA